VYVRLKGIHVVKAKLAGGQPVTYHYAWRGGPRLHAEPGTPEFIAEFAAAAATRKAPRDDGTVGALVSQYKASSDFTGRRDRTRKDYLRYLGMIEAKFGDMPIEALSDPRVRGDFKEWRDSMAATPRKADLAWSVLARVFSVAKDRGKIAANPCERGGRLYAVDRTDAIWTDHQIEIALAGFPERLRWVLVLAIWTGQRQGDILRLPWSAYDGAAISLRQSKTGRRVRIPVGQPLREMLAAIKKRGPIILTSSDDKPWTSDGFRSSWGRAIEAAGITGVRFNDLRGSAVTRLAEAGCTVPEIAAITGHSLATVEGVLDRHYLSRSNALGESAMRKLEAKVTGTKVEK